ncbi:MAG: fructose-bisphosphatase class III, partial [Anaerococcus sp.]|nr:fructose-bisphosphatase class III [Peptoniphilaceae bacterium]MDY3054708.1 fructose-bisphosphatase class III [Anaerococcus sp.]
EGYGLNLRPLYEFAVKTYRDDPCERFMPRIYEENIYDKINKEVAAKMFKAMSIIRFKLDGQLIERNPEFQMDSRNFLRFVDFENMTYKGAKLLDTNFPTIDPKDPLRLTEEEEFVTSVLQREFLKNPLLNKHIKFLYSHGSMYKISNGSLLFHGCIPLKENGEFEELTIKGKAYKGKALMDIFETYIRKAYFSKDKKEISFAKDLIWYLFYGKTSPLFGKSQYSYFENLLVEDKSLKKEVMNPYFELSKKEEVCDMILDEFGLDGEKRRIINGHVPVKVIEGVSPVRANGKLYVIDGGISKPYQKKTGIAGYTLMFNSHHLALAEHRNFPTIRNNMGSYTPKIIETEKMIPRMLIKDTDKGCEIKEKIEVLEELLAAYDKGLVKEVPNK